MAGRSKPKSEQTVSPDIQRLRHNVRLDRIHYMPLNELVLHNRRLRKRSDAARRALVASVSGFGIVLPILIDGNSVVVAGEGILEAAQRCCQSNGAEPSSSPLTSTSEVRQERVQGRAGRVRKH